MKAASFWSHFEEHVTTSLPGSPVNAAATKTQTAAREEDDQDVASADFSAIHRGTLMATKTITNTREEMDQDPPGSGYASIGVSSYSGTQTVTKVAREEADQDPDCLGYRAIPVNPS